MLFTILATAVAVSLDGLSVGFAYGASKIKIPIKSLLFLCLIPTVLCYFTMNFSYLIKDFLDETFIKYFGFSAMLLLSLFSFRQYILSKKESKPSYKAGISDILAHPDLADKDKDKMIDLNISEGIILGLALSIDALAGSAVLAFLGADYIISSLAIGISNLIFISTGNLLGKKIKKSFINFRLVPVFIFLILALLRFF